MTHEYTLLTGGTVIRGAGEPDATAIAWAGDTILALGADEDVRAISRGDSRVVDLHGAFVVPLGGLGPLAAAVEAAQAGGIADPAAPVLEVGGRADLVVLGWDPRLGPACGPGPPPAGMLALVRRGRVVAGALPGAQNLDRDDHEH